MISRTRIWTLISLLIIVPIGFYSKFYTGPAEKWVNNSLGGVFYVIFWCLLVFLVFPDGKPRVMASGVLLVTCLLEVLQLWQPPFLQWLRSYFMGRTILGTAFTWSDFLYYIVGWGFGWFWISRLQNLNAKSNL